MIRLLPHFVFAGLLAAAVVVNAQVQPLRALPVPSPAAAQDQQPELVDIRSVDPTIVVDLRYSGNRNIAGRPLYPPNMPALVRPPVAAKLALANSELATRNYRLKIWDAYRPKTAHDQLWRLYPMKDYVGNPNDGIGSLHTWGVAVDATLVDNIGREVQMPTEFDVFSPDAMLRYTGRDPVVAFHLHVLQRAMAHAGFFGMRTEWWHFVSRGWTQYKPINEVTLLVQQATPTPTPRPQTFGGSTASSR
ncbi:MAG: M15 family metallopeptidase [Chthoniobacterales bacterium]